MEGVLGLMRQIYLGSHPGSKKSWTKLNATLRRGLSLAICSEMHFERTDLESIYFDYGGPHWMGDGEWVLEEACEMGNPSAAASLNAWKGRKAFRWPAAEITPRASSSWRPPAKKLDLLYVGATFLLDGESVTVTSFSPDGEALVACSYDEVDPGVPLGLGMLLALFEVRVRARESLDDAELISSLEAVRSAVRSWSTAPDLHRGRTVKRRHRITLTELKIRKDNLEVSGG